MDLLDILREEYPVTEGTAAALYEISTLKSYKKKEMLCEQGKMCHEVFFTRAGIVRCFYTDGEHEDTRWFGTTGDVYTSMASFYAGMPSFFSIQAVTDVEVYTAPVAKVRELARFNFEFKDWAYQLLIGQLFALEKRYTYVGMGDAYARYSAFQHLRPVSITREIPLKYIAQYLKITPQSLSRLRRRYAKEGNITMR